MKRATDMRLGSLLEFVVGAAIVAVPVVRGFDKWKDTWVLVAWCVVFVAREIYNRWKLGKFAEIGSGKVLAIHGAVAGSIDTLTRMMLNQGGRRLTEEETKRQCIGLLHRVKDYAQIGLGLDDGIRVRANLAVPLPKGGRDARELRVWCYDQPHDDRRWSVLPLRLTNGHVLPGAPEAFQSGQIQIVPDIHAEHSVEGARTRKFRCVLSIPVKAGGPNGSVLAVLNLDATEPNIFTEEDVTRAVIPLVAPSVNLIALILLMRAEGSSYDFDS